MKTQLKINLALTCFFIYLLSFNCFAQKVNIDSIQKELNKLKHDTLKCEHLSTLIESEYNDSIWPIYNEMLLDFSLIKMKNEKGKLKEQYAVYYAYSLLNKGYFSMIKSNYEESETFYLQSLEIEQQFDNKEGQAYVYNNLAYLYRKQGNILKALEFYHNALNMQLALKNEMGIAIAYNNIAFVFDIQKEYKNASDYYNKSLEIFLKLDDKEGVALAYGNLASIYSKFGEPNCKQDKETCLKKGLEIGVDYLLKSIDLHFATGNLSLKANALNQLAGIYHQLGVPLCNKSFDDCKKLADSLSQSLYLEALQIRIDNDEHYGLSESYNSLSRLELDNNNVNKSFEYAQKSMSYAQKSQSPELLMSSSEILKEIYVRKMMFKEALEMNELFYSMRDSLNNDENKQMTIKKTFQLEYELEAEKESLIHQAKINEERLISEAKVKQQRYYTYGGLVGFILMLVVALISFKAFKNKQKANVIIHNKNLEVEAKNTIIEGQKELVEEKQKEILESITYAKRIQEAILPPESFISEHLSNYFIYYQPKDIVAGDFYWSERIGDLFFIAAADSTGHGVPGALVSVVCSSALNRSVKEFKLTTTGAILDKTKELVVETFEKSNQDVKDGMDISLLCIDNKNKKVFWSGANNALVYIQNNELFQLSPDKQPIGKTELVKPFTTHEIAYVKDSSFYLFTDGYADQFGGEKDKKFRPKALFDLIFTNHELAPSKQMDILKETFENWKGRTEQVDDVCIIGVRL